MIYLFPELRQNGMPRRGESHIRAEHGLIPHVNMGVVHHGQIEIGVNAIAPVAVPAAEIGVKGRLNIAVFPDFGKHFLHQALALLLLQGAGLVVLIKQLQTLKLLRQNLFVPRKIELPGVHFFLHSCAHTLTSSRKIEWL